MSRIDSGHALTENRHITDRAILVTSNPVMRLGLQTLMQRSACLFVMASPESMVEALDAIDRYTPEVVLLDCEFADQVIESLQQKQIAVRILLLSQNPFLIQGASEITRQHACGLCHTGAPLRQIELQIATIALCQLPRPGWGPCNLCSLQPSLRTPRLPLSSREHQIFECIGKGERPATMARSLGISVKTVESHRENIKRKLGLRTAAELSEAAFRWRDGDRRAASRVPWTDRRRKPT